MLLTKLLLLPLVLHVLHTLMIGIRTFNARVRAIKNGSAKMHEIASDSGAWPSKVRVLGNNFDSQFDTPMFWYVVCTLVVTLKFEDWTFVALSWVFLLSRVWHSSVHIGNNDVVLRSRIYLFGFFTVVTMWLWLAVKLGVAG
jgi:hypothetical protein